MRIAASTDAPTTESAVEAASEWTVQLLGIDPAVPWTGPLTLTFELQTVVELAADAAGRCRFVPPSVVRQPHVQQMQVAAGDANYRLLRSSWHASELQFDGHAEFAVVPVAQLRGRVVDADGNGLVARVHAFALRFDGPHEPLLGRAESLADGSYLLRVPPGTPLLLIAEGIDAGVVLLSPAVPLLQLAPGHVTTRLEAAEDLSLLEERAARTDLLPAVLQCEAVFGEVHEVADLRLGRRSDLRGRVVFGDGRALAHAIVSARPVWVDKRPALAGLHWSAHGALVPETVAFTNVDGRFSMWLAPGERYRVAVTGKDPLLLAGEPAVEAMAPNDLELVLPGRLVTLRVVDGAQRVPNAKLRLGAVEWPANSRGELGVTVGDAPLRVRAEVGTRTSPWHELSPLRASSELTLALLDEPLVALRVDLLGVPMLRRVTVEWHSAEHDLRHTFELERTAANEPFVVPVPVGRCTVGIRGARDDRDGQFLVPLQLDVEVLAAGGSVTGTGCIGGGARLLVKDAQGALRGGSFMLRDGAGREVATPTIVRDTQGGMQIGGPGQLQPDHENRLAAILAPGAYSLTFHSEGSGPVERSFVVMAGEIALVAVLLP